MHSVQLDVAAALAPPRTCPDCGSGRLVAVCTGDVVAFECGACRTTWLPELGSLVTTASAVREGGGTT